jgi:hypothetical protein
VDFEALIRDQCSEDELLEFKRTLATPKGDTDRRVVDQTDIGVTAKRDLLAEVVAMANSYGGDVIMGIAETQEKPPRAKELVSLPRCVELAHRLELAARDLIKPELPTLGIRGIPLNGGAGLVIFRVPRSRSVPHRLEIKGMEKECYKRVSDRTETMTMREIRDLTFSVVNGIGAVDRRFAELRSEFHTWAVTGIPSQGVGVRRQSYRISAFSLSANLFLERVHRVESVEPVPGGAKVLLNGNPYEFVPLVSPYNWHPVLRGI